MSGVVTVNPLMKSIGPFSYGDQQSVQYDFTELLRTGETIVSSSIALASEPAGFTFGTPSLSGNVVFFQITAPTTAGVYIVSATVTTQGVSPAQKLTRSARANVLQQ